MFDNMTFRLSCKVNNYHWGKVGKNSKVAVYAASNPSFKIDPYKNYSELWMGTHPNGPSALYEDPSMSLGTLIDQDPIEMLSAPVASKFHNQLPFLFKVLSINTALSIQAHPDKALATKLHQQFPHIYKDPNHKPEMAVALTVFEAMSGFRPLHEIADHLKNYPEFATLVGQDRADRFIEVASNPQPHSLDVQKRLLREVFTALMNSDPLLVKAQIERLLVRVPYKQGMPRGSLPELIHRLNHDYPYDVGVFCLFMLNVFQLAPGEALYMGANDPHAYISGDCVECMATSDNVVRAGLTPKLRDVPVLVDMLTYDFGPPETKITRGVKYVDARNIESETSKLYDPPIEEFSVLQTSLSPGHSESFYNTSGPTILIVTAGKGVLTVVDSDVDSNEQRDSGEDKSSSESQDLATGYVIFVKPGTSYRLEADNDHRLEVYAAWCTA